MSPTINNRYALIISHKKGQFLLFTKIYIKVMVA